ncbi:hypothetical protein BCR42DRAFT_404357 [Absidia repens]|uniref:Retrotransposon gag domain-containing protein n=1 Tax=Absidia repens TaxID=90262 RepID=A0A1X2IXQ6_9FUNG|nr:hypothetical protein BCR42DRAFT_404357 [Absidia repens]
MNRIRKGATLDDEQALLVAGSHLRGSAEQWWAIYEDSVETWDKFQLMFKQKYVG